MKPNLDFRFKNNFCLILVHLNESAFPALHQFPVEMEAMMSILNLPKEIGANCIFTEPVCY